MGKKTERQLAKDRAWEWCSKLVRIQYSKDGLNQCITCGVIKPIREMQAGHGIGGRQMGVLFDRRIIMPQCPKCNKPPPEGMGGNYNIYVPWIIDTFGREEYDQMIINSRTPQNITTSDLRDLAKEFRLEYNQYKKGELEPLGWVTAV